MLPTLRCGWHWWEMGSRPGFGHVAQMFWGLIYLFATFPDACCSGGSQLLLGAN